MNIMEYKQRLSLKVCAPEGKRNNTFLGFPESTVYDVVKRYAL